MQKREKFYLGLFSVLAVLGFAAFAYSQGVGLPSSGSIPNPGHKSEDILCVGCVDTQNIKDNSIRDVDVWGGVGSIRSTKVHGANGWLFVTGSMPSAGTWSSAPGTVSNMISTLWVGSFVEIICDSQSGPGINGPSDLTVIDKAGLQKDGIYRSNHYIGYVPLTPSSVEIYRAESTSSVYQTLSMRTAGGLGLEFSRTGSGSGSTEPVAVNGFKCFVKILSTCPGGILGGAAC